MQDLIPSRVQQAVNALLTGPAVSSSQLRQGVEAYAARLSGGVREDATIPDELAAFVEKVSRHAYQVTDQDIERLKAAGYSEDAIFELTLCAGVGASLARLERGLAALQGEQ